MLNDKLVLTGNYPFPIHVNQGVVFARYDTTVAHEEADAMIIQQVAMPSLQTGVQCSIYQHVGTNCSGDSLASQHMSDSIASEHYFKKFLES